MPLLPERQTESHQPDTCLPKPCLPPMRTTQTSTHMLCIIYNIFYSRCQDVSVGNSWAAFVRFTIYKKIPSCHFLDEWGDYADFPSEYILHITRNIQEGDFIHNNILEQCSNGTEYSGTAQCHNNTCQ